MNRVLDYAARHGRRGTVYGTASLCLAGTVLAAPVGLTLAATLLQKTLCGSGFSPCYRLDSVLLEAPTFLTITLPLAGLALGALGLALRCKRHQLVTLGVLINIAGLIAAVGAIMLVG